MERVQGIEIMTHQLQKIEYTIQAATELKGCVEDTSKLMKGPFPWETDYGRKQNDELEGCYTK
eukprot:658554-Pyramimonas_sp.AAC.1